jgi:hypothetical protein
MLPGRRLRLEEFRNRYARAYWSRNSLHPPTLVRVRDQRDGGAGAPQSHSRTTWEFRPGPPALPLPCGPIKKEQDVLLRLRRRYSHYHRNTRTLTWCSSERRIACANVRNLMFAHAKKKVLFPRRTPVIPAEQSVARRKPLKAKRTRLKNRPWRMTTLYVPLPADRCLWAVSQPAPLPKVAEICRTC